MVGGAWCESLIAAPRVSLAHNAATCLAAISAPGKPVGVDLEALGRIQQPKLLVESLAPQEQPCPTSSARSR